VTRPLVALLELGRAVTLDGVERTLERRAGTAERPIVRVSGVSDREGAEALRGADLLVARSQAPELGEGEWWAHELEGCAVVDGDRAVGEVRELRALPSCEVLVVERTGDGGELLVPLVSDAVRSVDVAAKRIEVDLGFLEGPEA
jgi:16S rRNA processing protein RimM